MAKNRKKDGGKGSSPARVSAVYLLHRFADDLFVLLLGDFLPLVKGLDGRLHFTYSFLLDLLFLKNRQKPVGWRKEQRDKRRSWVGAALQRLLFLSWSCRPELGCGGWAEWWRRAAAGSGALWPGWGGGRGLRNPPPCSPSRSKYRKKGRGGC